MSKKLLASQGHGEFSQQISYTEDDLDERHVKRSLISGLTLSDSQPLSAEVQRQQTLSSNDSIDQSNRLYTNPNSTKHEKHKKQLLSQNKKCSASQRYFSFNDDQSTMHNIESNSNKSQTKQHIDFKQYLCNSKIEASPHHHQYNNHQQSTSKQDINDLMTAVKFLKNEVSSIKRELFTSENNNQKLISELKSQSQQICEMKNCIARDKPHQIKGKSNFFDQQGSEDDSSVLKKEISQLKKELNKQQLNSQKAQESYEQDIKLLKSQLKLKDQVIEQLKSENKILQGLQEQNNKNQEKCKCHKRNTQADAALQTSPFNTKMSVEDIMQKKREIKEEDEDQEQQSDGQEKENRMIDMEGLTTKNQNQQIKSSQNNSGKNHQKDQLSESDIQYINHIQALSQKVNLLQVASSNLNPNINDRRESLDNQQQSNFLSNFNSNIINQITSQQTNGSSTNNQNSLIGNIQKNGDQIFAEIKKSSNNNNNDMSLDASSFIKEARSKSIILHNPLDIESFNLSPIKNKSAKNEKSQLCDRSSIQAILTGAEGTGGAKEYISNDLSDLLNYNNKIQPSFYEYGQYQNKENQLKSKKSNNNTQQLKYDNQESSLASQYQHLKSEFDQMQGNFKKKSSHQTSNNEQQPQQSSSQSSTEQIKIMGDGHSSKYGPEKYNNYNNNSYYKKVSNFIQNEKIYQYQDNIGGENQYLNNIEHGKNKQQNTNTINTSKSSSNTHVQARNSGQATATTFLDDSSSINQINNPFENANLYNISKQKGLQQKNRSKSTSKVNYNIEERRKLSQNQFQNNLQDRDSSTEPSGRTNIVNNFMKLQDQYYNEDETRIRQSMNQHCSTQQTSVEYIKIAPPSTLNQMMNRSNNYQQNQHYNTTNVNGAVQNQFNGGTARQNTSASKKQQGSSSIQRKLTLDYLTPSNGTKQQREKFADGPDNRYKVSSPLNNILQIHTEPRKQLDSEKQTRKLLNYSGNNQIFGNESHKINLSAQSKDSQSNSLIKVHSNIHTTSTTKTKQNSGNLSYTPYCEDSQPPRELVTCNLINNNNGNIGKAQGNSYKLYSETPNRIPKPNSYSHGQKSANNAAHQVYQNSFNKENTNVYNNHIPAVSNPSSTKNCQNHSVIQGKVKDSLMIYSSKRNNNNNKMYKNLENKKQTLDYNSSSDFQYGQSEINDSNSLVVYASKHMDREEYNIDAFENRARYIK